MNRAEEPGWIRIGVTCLQGRRSLWWRVTPRDDGRDTPEIIELCAGREGDDAYAQFRNDGSKQFYDLWDVLCCAQFAGET